MMLDELGHYGFLWDNRKCALAHSLENRFAVLHLAG